MKKTAVIFICSEFWRDRDKIRYLRAFLDSHITFLKNSFFDGILINRRLLNARVIRVFLRCE